MAVESAAPERLVARVQELSERVASIADPVARRTAEDLVSAVVEMYGAGLERIVATAGPTVAESLAEDGLVSSLLLIHDLHPVPLEERVAQALERVRPYMESHGGDVELLGVEDGVAHLRLAGSCKSCAASSATLELAVRQALEDAAPDLEGMDVEGATPSGVPLPMAQPAWSEVEVGGEALASIKAAGKALVVADVEGTLLAYLDSCVACGGRLSQGELSGGALTCSGCGRSFDLRRAGKSLDDESIQLAPVPLLRENGAVRVLL